MIKVRHKPTGIIMARKVSRHRHYSLHHHGARDVMLMVSCSKVHHAAGWWWAGLGDTRIEYGYRAELITVFVHSDTWYT